MATAMLVATTGCSFLEQPEQSETAETSAIKAPNPQPPAEVRATGNPQPTLSLQAPPEHQETLNLDTLRSQVDQIQARYGGQVGLAFSIPGSGSAEEFGTLKTGPAWSTSKVPIAVARNRIAGLDNNISAAITASDNQAAAAMWASLGDPATAAALSNQVLRDGGDFSTFMETNHVRPEFSTFGQTTWSVREQAIFGANLQCISGGPQVVDLMGQIIPGQNYGLGNIAGAHFKGGWGPGLDGVYLARQFGFVPGAQPGTFVGVAIAARPGDGTYTSAQAMLNELSARFSEFPAPGGTC